MLSQYLEIKKKHADAVLFYRMGDFYEMFLEDAILAAPILEVQLTSRDRNSEHPIPLCGVPHHSAMGYIQKLLAAGLKVALCEQVEDPATAKGIVKREVVRVLTPALIGDPDLVPTDSTNFLMSLKQASAGIDVVLVDLLGCQIKQGELSHPKPLFDLLLEYSPREILIDDETARQSWLKDMLSHYPSCLLTKRDEYFKNGALSAVKDYLRETQKMESASYLMEPTPLHSQDSLRLDPTTLASLEVLGKEHTLAEVLDYTVTAMGRRLLREWLTHPSKDLAILQRRQNAVQNFLENAPLGQGLKEKLADVRDLERLATKTALGLALPRDLGAIRDILKTLPEMRTLLARGTEELRELGEKLSPLPELTSSLDGALEDTLPAIFRDGGIFRSSYRTEIEEYRGLSQDAKGMLAAMETRERDRTGISTLKVKYNRVFGYTIEISKSQLSKVPTDYTRKQTIANGERYITEELKRFEEKVVTAEHKLKTLEESLFLELRAQVAGQSALLHHNARVLAEIDVLMSFAVGARERGYVRPELHTGWEMEIIAGRHPVIETLLPAGQFVPNSLEFSEPECRTLIITGPNMAGKSTIMRQSALIALMAHVGSFVPAERARIPLLDAIFTRIGSSDDLARGRSTFMVEMSEVSRILEKASTRSLILIDEIGRGTSTYDGLSLAWSLLEFIHTEVGAKTLFATHFHEITSLEKLLPGIRNANVLVDRWKDEIVFLHKLGEGVCNQSYGIEVAKLAGIPSRVLVRAKTILGHLETQSRRGDRTRNRALETHENQMGFFEEQKGPESQARLEN